MSEAQLIVTLDTSSEVPYHQQIRRQLEEAILREDVRPGDRLPAAPDLAESLGVSPATTSRAYRDLQVLGVVESFRGRGVMLCEEGREVLLKRRRRTAGPLGGYEANSTVSPLDHGTGARPLHTQIRETIQRDIASGTLQAGDLLPPNAVLARRFGVNNNTVGRAINDLKLLGILTARRGRGVSVAFPGEAEEADEETVAAGETPVKLPAPSWRTGPDEKPSRPDTVTVKAAEPVAQESFFEYADEEFTYFDPNADYTPEEPEYTEEEQADDGVAEDGDDGRTYFDPRETYTPEAEPVEEDELSEDDDEGLTYFDPNETYAPEDDEPSPGDEARGPYDA